VSQSKIVDVGKTSPPEEYIGAVVRIPTHRVKQLPDQPRLYFGKREMQRLRDSIAEIGQQQPATVIPWDDGTFRLRDGERRWRCCVDLRIPLLALVVEGRSAEEEFELSAAANMNRESHSPLERAQAMKRLRDGPLKRSVAEIARTFGVTEPTVASHLLIVDTLPRPIIDLLDPNKQGDRRRTLQMSAAVRLTALKDFPKDQARIANTIVRSELSLSAAMRLIDEFADREEIEEGRGRERKPSDHLRLLVSAVRRLQPQIVHFRKQEQRQIDELFAFLPPNRLEEVKREIELTIATLDEVLSKIAAVDGAGSRRSAGIREAV